MPARATLGLALLLAGPAAGEPALFASGALLLPAGTSAVLTLEETAPPGARAGKVLRVSLAQPLFAGGTTAVPAGAPGKARLVKDAGGRLVLSAQWIDLRGERIPLAGFVPLPSGSAPSLARGAQGLATVTRDTRVAPSPAALPGGP